MLEIGKYKVVKLTYNLHLDDENGELIEQTTVEKPLEFLYGAGLMLPKFESQLVGLKQDDDFTIKLVSDDAYGQINENAVVDLPKDVFLVDGNFDDELVKVGNTVPMMNNNGQRMNGLVLEVTDSNVKMDFNHPLAGKDLHFDGKVVGVREASDEEVAQILAGTSGCSCGDGDCASGSCDSEGGSCGCGC